MSSQPHPCDGAGDACRCYGKARANQLELSGLNRLAGARVVIDALLQGHSKASAGLLVQLGALLMVASSELEQAERERRESTAA